MANQPTMRDLYRDLAVRMVGAGHYVACSASRGRFVWRPDGETDDQFAARMKQRFPHWWSGWL